VLPFSDEWLDSNFILLRHADQLHALGLVVLDIKLVQVGDRDFARRAPSRPELDHGHLASAQLERLALHVFER
jgi:hypothetical protein